jgi:hypothetical protein
MATYLPPVENPRSPLLKVMYFFMKRQFGRVMTPISVFSARMPFGFLSFYGKVSRLDKKLRLPATTARLVRAQVASLNTCAFCMDATRWYAQKTAPDDLAQLDALPQYRTSSLFSDGERAALDYATELTTKKEVAPETFSHLARFYDERQICDIVWLVASEHLYNVSNIGLNIGSDGLCERGTKRSVTAAPSPS